MPMRAQFSIASIIFLGASAALSLQPAAAAYNAVPASGASAQKVVPTMRLGDGTISGSRVKPFQVAWRSTFYPDNGPPITGGLWEQALRVDEIDGRKVLVRTTGGVVYGHASHKILGYIAHIALLDPETLAPIRSEHRDFDGSTDTYIVNGTHVEWHHKAADAAAKEEVHDFDTPVPAYDFAGAIIPFYLRALPLKVGYSGVIPEIGDPDHPLRGLPFKVVRRERISAGTRGMLDTWVVECPDPTAGMLHFWLSEKYPFPIRMAIPAVPGTPRQTYDLVD